MPDLLDDDALTDALRRYGTAVEAAARRVEPASDVDPGRSGMAPLLDYPVAPDGPTRAPGARRMGRPRDRHPRRRRQAVLVVVGVAMVVVVLAAALVATTIDRSSPAVDTPPSVAPVPSSVPRTNGTLPGADDIAAAPPFEDATVLLWLPYVGKPLYLGQEADRPVALDVGPATLAGCCNGIATINVMAAFIADGTLHTVDRTGEVVDTGVVGEQVVADRSYGGFYVVAGRELVRYGVSMPAGVDGSWAIPDGWELPSHSSASEVLDGRVILERSDRARADHEIAVWTHDDGSIRTIGQARWVVDATQYSDALPKLAWLSAGCGGGDGDCTVNVTDVDTLETRTAPPPAATFIGGGAFSPDGSHLALFVGGEGQLAELAVLDLATMEVVVLPGTAVTIGESFGSATWTLDNSSVIYHGLGPTRVIDIETGEQRSLPWDVTYSMATIP